jgi:superfamily II DNA or RNA helicase
MDVPTLLNWSDPFSVSTRNGIRSCRSAIPTEDFWKTWKEHKQTLMNANVSVFRHEQKGWTVYWWDAPKSNGVPERKLNHHPLAPSTEAKLRDYQVPIARASVAALMAPDIGAYLNSSAMGTGKTFCSCATVKDMDHRMLVVCRKAAFAAWQEVSDYFDFKKGHVTIINPELLRNGNTPIGTWQKEGKREVFFWRIPGDTVVVWDEVHNCGGTSSLNADCLMGLRRQRIKTLALSATAANSPAKLKALGYLLGLHQGIDFYPWTYKFGCADSRYGLKFTCGMSHHQIISPGGQKELERRQLVQMQQIHDLIFKTGKGIRISTSQIPGFPETVIIPTELAFDETERINAIYAEMERELKALAVRPSSPAGRALMVRARQQTELLKVPEIIEEARNAVEEGYSVAIFVSFTDTVRAIRERLKTNCVVVGGQTDAERFQAIADFQTDRERIIILNVQAGGESIGLHDLHGRFPRLSLISPSFWAESIIQALGRVCRDGALSKSIQRIIFAKGTIEEDAYKNFVEKQRRIAAFNGEFTVTDYDLQMKLAA